MKVWVIIPAAGLGTRMTGALAAANSAPKQFADLRGVPIIVHTIRAFAKCDSVHRIVIATLETAVARLQAEIEKFGLATRVAVVTGGENRQESVANALVGVVGDEQDIVLVHDAVRPFVSPEIIANVVAAAQKHGSAIAGVPAIDTIKQVDRTAEGAIITSTIPRERIVLAQTPQGFRLGVLKRVFAEAAADGFLGTDEASLAERAGYQVAVVMGSPRNFKITTPGDLALAEFYYDLNEREVTKR